MNRTSWSPEICNEFWHGISLKQFSGLLVRAIEPSQGLYLERTMYADLGLAVPVPERCNTDAPKKCSLSTLLRQPFIRQKYFGRSVSLAVEKWKLRRILNFRHGEGKGPAVRPVDMTCLVRYTAAASKKLCVFEGGITLSQFTHSQMVRTWAGHFILR